ncbi:MAG: NAD(P)H-dependent oxidoreductase subunit E [Bacteroidales bacterium]
MEAEIESIIQKHLKNQRDILIPVLQDIQKEFGYISEEAVIKIGRYLNLPTSKIFGVATFYDEFHFQVKGRLHIIICRGTTCHLSTSLKLLEDVQNYLNIKPGEISRDGMYSLSTNTCMGACGLAPVISINGVYYEQMTIDTFKELLESLRQRLS